MYRPISSLRSLSADQSHYAFRSREWSGQNLGTILVAYREAYGKSIEDVADDLCIRRAYIRALENETYGDLPQQSYATGFVRSYAKYLGLPPEEMVGRFRESYREHAHKFAPLPRMGALATTSTVSYSPRWPSFAIMVVAALLLGSSYMVMAAYTAVTNPIPQNGSRSYSNLDYIGPSTNDEADQVLFDTVHNDINIEFEIVPSGDGDTVDDSQINIGFEGPTDIIVDVSAQQNQTVIYGVNLPRPRPDTSQIKPQSLELANQLHRVVIKATGHAFLTISDHDTGEAFLRAEYQRGDKYLVPDNKTVQLLSSNVDSIELIIDGAPYRVAPAIAALNEPIVIDPDIIINTTQLIRIE